MNRSRSFSKFVIASLGLFCFALPLVAQKGIDSQTEKIKQEGNPTSRPSDVSRSFDWGKGKTKVRAMLPNPYKIASRRDALINAIQEVLRDRKIILDEASSRLPDGYIVTQPFVFAKGIVLTRGELARVGEVADPDTAWTRAQYTLTIDVQTIDGIQNKVSVNAKIEGRAGNGLTSEWLTVPSSGVIEDEFLSKLVETVTGTSPDPVQDVPKDDGP
ncbi:MAG TPA: hypothetical protein PKC65_04990 [Pyrinomonadaceae bacterium]|nr:hypothetical protein [Pyrinomonadaceae bacterium]